MPEMRPDTLPDRCLYLHSPEKARENSDLDDLPIDESKMEHAMMTLAGEAEKIKEDDPRQAADLMRKLSDMTGLKLGQGMEEALARMEQGEDPEQIEADMGDRLEQDDLFALTGKRVAEKNESPRRAL